jgi:hypothetical protein
MGDVAISGRLAGTTLNNGIETLQRAVVGSDGSQWTLEQGVIGGERNTSSLTNNYDAVKHEANSNILQNVATAQNIGTGGTTPIYLMGIQIRTALTGTLTIVGFTDPAGTAKNWVLPIGTVGQVLPPGNARRLESGCTMTLSVAADGDFVVVDWRPI